MTPGDVRIGISGWRYAPWRGVFYPPGLPQRRELEYAAHHLGSVEINGSFYSLQRPDSYRAWRAETPEGFVFAVKGPRFVTHMKKLVDVGTPLANFFASGVLALEDRTGPVLWQLPPNLGFDADRLARFLDLLPRSTAAAARLAEGHDDKVPEGRALTTVEEDRPLRHVLEVRHDSFLTPAFPELLRAHDVGLVVADTAGRWPHLEVVTSDVVYVRLHGDEELYVSGYGDEALDAWAAKVRAWSTGTPPPDGLRLTAPAPDRPRDVHVYFDNDAKVHAPFDAMALAARVGVVPPGPAPRAAFA